MITVTNNYKVKEKKQDSRYVQITNRGTFVAFWYVEYTFNDKHYFFKSPYRLTGESYAIPLPSTSTNISITAFYSDTNSIFHIIDELNFQNSCDISLSLTGNESNASITENFYASNAINNTLNHPIAPPLYIPLNLNV